MASTTTDDGFHEIQLNGKQLVFLFMAVTVVSVVIFLCGVLVGRGVRTERAATEPATETAVAEAAPAPPPAAVSAPAGAPATANETLTYANRLASSEPPKEQLSPAGQQAAAPKPSTPAPAPAPATSAAAASPAKQTTPPPAPAPAAPPPAVAAGPPVATEPSGPGFAIQLAALRQREEADGVARRLTSKGYPAYVMAPDAGAPSVFRVRVGKFKDRREADAVAARLQKEEQFNPWIVR
jgi:DedD protein